MICEELQIPPGSDKASAVKTFITERHTMTEHKGHDVQLVEQVCAFMFTTNHTPLWLEQGDRRFYYSMATVYNTEFLKCLTPSGYLLEGLS